MTVDATAPHTGVLLVNLGTPDAPTRGAVYRYLKQFLLDARVLDISWLGRQLLVRGVIAPFRSGKSAQGYRKLWTENGSPLKYYGQRLAAGVGETLGPGYAVALGMRYQHPSVESAIDGLLSRGVSRLVVLPLFPQYSSACNGSVHQEVMRVLSGKQSIPEVRLVNSFPTLPGMVRLFAANAMKYEPHHYDHILFSYHGLPERQIRKADEIGHCLRSGCCEALTVRNQFCYRAQCVATTRAIALAMDLTPDQYTICFQSRLGRAEWIKPYTSDVLKELSERGAKRLLVLCPAFVADCLETVIEIGEEYQEEFEELGGERVQLVESLNDHPDWIETVAQFVRTL